MKNNRKNIRQIGLGLGVLLCMMFSFSCKTGKKAATQRAAKHAAQQPAPAGDTSAYTVIDLPKNFLKEREIPYHSFSGKIKCHYENRNQKQDFTAHVRIRKDEAIWISISALGGIVQVARILITPDSFRMVNYLEKQVTERNLEEAVKILPVPADFHMLQNLLTGQALKPEAPVERAEEETETFRVYASADKLHQEITFRKADTTIQLFQMQSADPSGPSGTIHCDGYIYKNGRRFSMDRTIQVQNSGEAYALDMEFQSASFDVAVDLPFSVPGNYERK